MFMSISTNTCNYRIVASAQLNRAAMCARSYVIIIDCLSGKNNGLYIMVEYSPLMYASRLYMISMSLKLLLS